MDDGFLMRVLHGFANEDEQLQTLAGGELVFVAIIGDRDAGDILHDEVRAALGSGAGVEHFGDSGVVHERESLPLGFKPRDDFAGVHASLDQLEATRRRTGSLLLGQPNFAHAALTDHFEQPVRADHRPCGLNDAANGDSCTSGGSATDLRKARGNPQLNSNCTVNDRIN